jgi:nucleoside-triphosphatase THEP1
MTSSSLKSFVSKMFEESLRASEFMSKIIDNVGEMAVEIKKVADLLLKTNERLNQHERVILTLLNLHNERERKEKEKEKNVDYTNVKSAEKPPKPN